MGTSFAQGSQSASALGEWFTAGDLMAGTVAVTSAKLTESVTTSDNAGGTFVPTFVLFSTDIAPDAGVNYAVTTSATVVTFTRATSTAADVIHYIIGNLE